MQTTTTPPDLNSLNSASGPSPQPPSSGHWAGALAQRL
jgi:hypothetical protein